jgi:hypothetical protein
VAAWNRDGSRDGTERAAAASSRSGGRPRGAASWNLAAFARHRAAYLASARRILDCPVQAEDVAGDGAYPRLRGRGVPRPRRAGDRWAPFTGRLLSVETVPETDHRDIVLSPHLHDRIAALTAPEPAWTASTGTAA